MYLTPCFMTFRLLIASNMSVKNLISKQMNDKNAWISEITFFKCNENRLDAYTFCFLCLNKSKRSRILVRIKIKIEFN